MSRTIYCKRFYFTDTLTVTCKKAPVNKWVTARNFDCFVFLTSLLRLSVHYIPDQFNRRKNQYFKSIFIFYFFIPMTIIVNHVIKFYKVSKQFKTIQYEIRLATIVIFFKIMFALNSIWKLNSVQPESRKRTRAPMRQNKKHNDWVFYRLKMIYNTNIEN